MSRPPHRFLLVSDFNVDVLRGFLTNDEELPLVEATSGPFGQPVSVLVNKDMVCWKRTPDYVVVWTRPESVIPSFKAVMDHRAVSMEQLMGEVDAYCHMLSHLEPRVRYTFVPTWVVPSYSGGCGLLEMKQGVGVTDVLTRMNVRLADGVAQSSKTGLMNTGKWIAEAGTTAFSPKLWYLSKVAFGNYVFAAATRDIKAALRGLTGQSRKLIILDLDDTLWGGIVGDVGWQGLNLGGHDAVGEAYVDFQRVLKSLTNRGILLGIVSKNTESVALEAINNHPEMILRQEDFAGWKISWDDKAQGVVDLVSDLNLGLQSAVFIDDNPIERARVREALPEVFVPDWPENCMLYKNALLRLPCFDVPSISHEDRERARMYASDRKRRSVRRRVDSLEDWLKTLRTTVAVEELTEANLKRVVQLMNRTNQMNLTTRRVGESALADWVGRDNHTLWTFRVSDEYGDSGLTGIISLAVHQKVARIVDFVLSCRVMGRKVEEAMVHVGVTYAQMMRLDEVIAQYIPTSKNQPCLAFWKRSGFNWEKRSNRFTWQTRHPYALPEVIRLRHKISRRVVEPKRASLRNLHPA